ncbi:MAG: IS200/IS605 family transposase [Candidatus Syntrophosphaera sp.]|nr:IS200/IS605 family transposase [Candidatus Syntrophosphaera sp.]
MSSNTITFLLYHIVFSVRNREPRLVRLIRDSMYPYMGGVIKNIGGIPIVINGTRDHVHILCFLPRHISLSESIKIIKAKSSLRHNRNFNPNGLPLHWQDGYGIFTVAAEQMDKVKHYIVEQDQHHMKRGFAEEWDILHNKAIDYMNKSPEMISDFVED